MMNDKISNASLTFACTQDWDVMTIETDGRFCSTCQKKVYDLSDKNVAYFISIMQENNNKICGRFTTDQLISPPPALNSIWKRWAIAAMVLIGINVSAQKANAQEKLMGKVALKSVEPDCEKYPVMGEIAIIPSPEIVSLHSYLAQTVKLPSSVNGNLAVSFSINKLGEFVKLTMGEQQPHQVRLEVLKALKKAPKWTKKPYDIKHPFSLWLTIKKGNVLPFYN
jgi:hypothetical protein